MWMKNCKNIFRDFVSMVYTLLTIVYFKSLFKNDGNPLRASRANAAPSSACGLARAPLRAIS